MDCRTKDGLLEYPLQSLPHPEFVAFLAGHRALQGNKRDGLHHAGPGTRCGSRSHPGTNSGKSSADARTYRPILVGGAPLQPLIEFHFIGFLLADNLRQAARYRMVRDRDRLPVRAAWSVLLIDGGGWKYLGQMRVLFWRLEVGCPPRFRSRRELSAKLTAPRSYANIKRSAGRVLANRAGKRIRKLTARARSRQDAWNPPADRFFLKGLSSRRPWRGRVILCGSIVRRLVETIR
jgi:hypothetical protein